MALAKFSIIVPTYSGVATVGKTFESILKQTESRTNYELIVVIDGPGKHLRAVVDSYRNKFENSKIDFRVHQLPTNQGRFQARIVGATAARFNQLLFVDDRVRLAKNYLRTLDYLNVNIAMPRVKETTGTQGKNPISHTLFLIRNRVWGKKSSNDFTDYYIDINNFETSPKGTTSLWITKKVFLDACGQLSKNRKKSMKYINEDTKILRTVVANKHRILRSRSLVVFYQPRANLAESIKHLYERGPRFVDYYKKPGTKFFPILVTTYLFPILLVSLLMYKPSYIYTVLLLILTVTAIASVLISRDVKDLLTSLIGLPLIGIVFSLGIWKGTMSMIKESVAWK